MQKIFVSNIPVVEPVAKVFAGPKETFVSFVVSQGFGAE